MSKQERRDLRQGFNDGLHWVTKREPSSLAYQRGYKHGKAHPKSVAKQQAWRAAQWAYPCRFQRAEY